MVCTSSAAPKSAASAPVTRIAVEAKKPLPRESAAMTWTSTMRFSRRAMFCIQCRRRVLMARTMPVSAKGP